MTILIQQDNASPHVLEGDAEVLAAANKDGWAMQITQQPAQSPDLNVLDLGFFNSVQALQDRTAPRTEQDLMDEVGRAFEATSAVTLNKTFLTPQFMMEHIMEHEGKNDFRLGHLKKDALIRIDQLPKTLTCDADVYRAAGQFIAAARQTQPVDHIMEQEAITETDILGL